SEGSNMRWARSPVAPRMVSNEAASVIARAPLLPYQRRLRGAWTRPPMHTFAAGRQYPRRWSSARFRGEVVAPVRGLQVLHRPQRDDAVWIDGGMAAVVVLLDVVEVDRPGDPRKLVQLPQVTGQVGVVRDPRSEEHTSELQSRENLVCR